MKEENFKTWSAEMLAAVILTSGRDLSVHGFTSILAIADESKAKADGLVTDPNDEVGSRLPRLCLSE